jgi:hypothetical protein
VFCGADCQSAADWQSACRQLARGRISTSDFRKCGGSSIRLPADCESAADSQPAPHCAPPNSVKRPLQGAPEQATPPNGHPHGVFRFQPTWKECDHNLRIAGTRLARFRCHSLPGKPNSELIAHSFSTVTLPHVYGAVAYHLENKKRIDDYFGKVEREFERRVRPLSETNPALFERVGSAAV